MDETKAMILQILTHVLNIRHISSPIEFIKTMQAFVVLTIRSELINPNFKAVHSLSSPYISSSSHIKLTLASDSVPISTSSIFKPTLSYFSSYCPACQGRACCKKSTKPLHLSPSNPSLTLPLLQ